MSILPSIVHEPAPEGGVRHGYARLLLGSAAALLVAGLLGLGGVLWLRHGSAVFFDTLAAGLQCF